MPGVIAVVRYPSGCRSFPMSREPLLALDPSLISLLRNVSPFLEMAHYKGPRLELVLRLKKSPRVYNFRQARYSDVLIAVFLR